MDVKWASLGQVLLVSLGATVAVVVIFSLGVLAASARRTAQSNARPDTGPAAAAALCFAACTVIVLYGIYLIVPQFH
ncbi:hypothetical protein [Actinomadura terrae]|uniref:hypothetical protein n=1 Tax=Actinomadura terrae TaxID=604353 RepID=UPI001FA76372|nr:hypothetical protein [Actinomadura terrae]